MLVVPPEPRAWDPRQVQFSPAVEQLARQLDADPAFGARVLEALARPQDWYSLRVTPWRVGDLERFLVDIRAREPAARFHPAFPDVLLVPVHGPHPVPPRPREKVVYIHEDAAERVMIGAQLYAPGVDRSCLPKLDPGDPVALASTTTGWVVARGTWQVDINAFQHQARGLAVDVTESLYTMYPFRTAPPYARGQIFDQGLPSYLVGYLAARVHEPGMRVLDACAAPGGKTTAFVQEAWRRHGEHPAVIALDRSRRRSAKLTRNLTRLGIGPASGAPIEVRPRTLQEYAARLAAATAEGASGDGSFDIVLVDPPCSGLGVRPKLSATLPPDAVLHFAQNQRNLLALAGRLVKPGGHLFYSTCTITLAENEDVVATLLEADEFRLRSITTPVGHPGNPRGRLTPRQARQTRRFYPHLDDTPGFFVAWMQKRA